MGVQDCDGRAGDLAVIGSGDGFRRIFEAAPLAMLICRLNGDFICANPAFYRLLRLEPAAPLAHSCDFVYADDVAAEHEFIRNAGRVPADRIRYRRGDGTVVDVERHAAVLPAERGGCLVIQIIDATRQKQQESAMRFLALHDPLTGLGNRLQFQERLTAA